MEIQLLVDFKDLSIIEMELSFASTEQRAVFLNESQLQEPSTWFWLKDSQNMVITITGVELVLKALKNIEIR